MEEHAPPIPPDTAPRPALSAPPERGALSALFYEWFVKYDPTYLLSAALVLGGLTLLSRDVALSSALGGLGITAIAETYALALIAATAVLCRIGQRRVAVMVGLLAALYQCDLTMHVETSAFLDGAGLVAVLAWAGLSHAKLRLLAAALELRASRSAIGVLTLGASVLAVLPHAMRPFDGDTRTTMVGLAVFGVFACGLWTHRTIVSAVGFDYRGRRAIRGVWILWSVGALLHVAYWSVVFRIDLAALVPVALLLATRWATRERVVWSLVAAALASALLLHAPHPASVALMVAATLMLRALRRPVIVETTSDEGATSAPYRGMDAEPSAPPEITRTLVFVRAEAGEMQRMLLGAASSVHLSLWALFARDGLWSAHLPPIDLALAITCVLVLWKTRSPRAAMPVALVMTHLAIEQQWLCAPRDAAEVGVWAIALGFGLLGGGVAMRYRLERRFTRPAET